MSGDSKTLDPPESFYQIPNSPKRTGLLISLNNLGGLECVDSSGVTCCTVDLKKYSEKIRSLKHAICNSNKQIDYVELPNDAFAGPDAD
jgi:hypothetical protein